MNSQQLKTEIENLSLMEKLTLVSDIWDSIARSKDYIPLTAAQMAELDLRYQEFAEGRQQLHEWEEVHEALRQKYKT